MSNFEEQRKNMVESQVRPSDVTDRRVIRSLAEVPRERFLSECKQFLAYADQDVVIEDASAQGAGRALMAPRVLAKMLQNLDIGDDDLALEVGAGTGYGSAVLARIAQTVVALESDPALAKQATEILAGLEVDNAVVVTGDLPGGFPEEGPYDAILVSGCVGDIGDGLLDQLKHGGRLVAVVAGARGGGLGQVVRWQRYGETFDSRVLFEASAEPLPGFERMAQFVF